MRFPLLVVLKFILLQLGAWFEPSGVSFFATTETKTFTLPTEHRQKLNWKDFTVYQY